MRTAVATCKTCGKEFTQDVPAEFQPFTSMTEVKKLLLSHELVAHGSTHWAAIYLDEYCRGHPDPYTAAVIATLEFFWRALEAGIVIDPDALHTFSIKLHWGTVEGRERFVAGLDAQYTTEQLVHALAWETRRLTHHPQFFRMPDPMRLALCQQLETVLLAYPVDD